MRQTRCARSAFTDTAVLLILGLAAAETNAQTVSAAFHWPVSGWITATDKYRWGETHSGSADIGTPYGQPVLAGRGGKATPTNDGYGALGVTLTHESGYTTEYKHLLLATFLASGQSVAACQVIGYSGRTGRATLPHVHFAIRRYGTRLVIPSISFGMWVTAASAVPGSYAGISATSGGFSAFTVRVTDDYLDVRSGPTQQDPVVDTLLRDAVVTVGGARDGCLSIGVGRWIPGSGTMQTRFNLFGIKTTQVVSLYTGPGTQYSTSGTDTAGTLETVFETSTGWYRILDGYPAYFYWIWGGYTTPSSQFFTKVTAVSADVRTGPGEQYPVVGTLYLGTDSDTTVVYATRNGWYRILHNGAYRWIQGWKTSGRV